MVSTTAGILMPKTEKNTAPTREINGSRSGTNSAMITIKKNIIIRYTASKCEGDHDPAREEDRNGTREASF